jgi:hypothetical protein
MRDLLSGSTTAPSPEAANLRAMFTPFIFALITGAAPSGADAISFKPPTSTSPEATLKKSGQPVLISKLKISADGKVTAITQTSAPGTGSVNNAVVYEKQ